MTKTTWIIEVVSDLAVIGYNPESADLDHPRGELIGEVFYLRATNGRGDRREFGSYSSFDAAEDAIPDAPAVLLWAEGRPEYGSEAYVAYGAAEDLAWEARQAEAERWGFDTRFAAF